ncbi:DNA-binding protein [Thermosipho melanesiensis]|uniref:Nucleic acid binding, OB-fold, tRNA/helicase-type n=2 Tax=Thermosipho melanesiensis TaxID=46541 RepID=A6LKM7_THEM4|nr:DNA-binding protein [Thermosipho melanesiensis]ABR30478.1 nucleic acid binding, OB-fold, tRNA/helicase-type [Thermosipho melanesiensis BI429]APT73632.1 DNA-binding protein [Thermosipho melanesiensis]OOC35574.1 DNA-binding protein [Thermosipho melanesiensis]OOC39248.1 DNA-binding protein [Thermosipho melanesiensis]OOC39334.1 DNA-binding protein [Thermosipho melanesiensis]
MRKIVIFIVLLFSILSFSNFSLSVLNLTTIGVDDGTLDYFPILYVTYQPFDFLSFKVTDYLKLTHDSFDLGMNSIFKPRYYYFETKFDIFGVNFKMDILKARLKKTQTEKFEGLRLGGLKFDYYGVGMDIKGDKFSLGVAYDIDYNNFAGYLQIELFGFNFGGYYETKYNQVSFDLTKSIDFGKFSIFAWGALSAKTTDIANFSYLIGARVNFGDFAFSTQYLKLGANKYDADYLDGDPNSVAFSSDAWAYYMDIDYTLNDYNFGLFLRYNSVWASNPSYLPLYGLKVSFKDFVFKIGNGDLIANISGEQKIAVELNYFYTLEFDRISLFGSKKKEISPIVVEKNKESAEIYNTVMDVILGEEGKTYVVKGIIASPKDLLSKGSFYIQDETAGLMIYAPSLMENLEVGDVVVVNGRSKLWNGIIEIVAKNVEKVGRKTPRPDVLTSLSKTFISSFVYVEGVVKEKRKFDFIVDTREFLIKIYLKKGTNIDISEVEVGKKVKVQGMLTVYKGEYEILPRYQEDIIIIQ